ncbi:MAG: NAD(P)H-hydrate dehydratase [Succinivibrio sp.]
MQLPIEVFTSDEIKLIEEDHARNFNGHCFDLMQKAGRAVFDLLVSRFPDAKEVWIFCGKGNNGGDGYIVANLLLEHSIRHRVFATGIPHEDTEARIAYEYYLRQGGCVEADLPNHGQMPSDGVITYTAPDVIVDALLGTGIESAPHGQMTAWIAYINKLGSSTVSIDVPSGVDADTGAVPGICVCADISVCMLGLKSGLLTGDAVDYVGEVVYDPLGLDVKTFYDQFDYATSRYPLPIAHLSYEDIRGELPERFRSCCKSDNGKVLIVAGSSGFGGAAIICGKGALRSGAGLVRVALEKENVQALLSVHPELMTADLNDPDAICRSAQWADVIAVGPGLGKDERACAILAHLDDMSDKYLVYDADALTLLSSYEQNFYHENRIITPHPGEAARLLGCSVDEVNADRYAACYRLWQKYGGVVLLKGAGTIVCNGRSLTVIGEGSPALATGGSGDLLTGIIASLAAQGLSLEMSAIVGACVHAKAGEICARTYGTIGCLPSDVSLYVMELINGRISA